MRYSSQWIEILIDEFSKLPGIGKKTAQRLALYLVKVKKEDALKLSDAIRKSKENIVFCNSCQNLTDIHQNPCVHCLAKSRNHQLISVVESPGDVIAFERTGHYNGTYHVLHGVISPLEGIGPDDLKIKELLDRIKPDKNNVEVIVALSPTVEGETTTLYLSKILKPLGVKVSRIARGIPIGIEIEYTDEATLTRALEGRVDI